MNKQYFDPILNWFSEGSWVKVKLSDCQWISKSDSWKKWCFSNNLRQHYSQANQVFMTSNDNPNLAVEPDLSTIYLSQIHQTQRNFPGKQWIIQCLVTSCKTQRDTFWPWQLDTPTLTKYITICIISLAWQRSKGWTAVEFRDSTLPYILFNQMAEMWGDCLRCVPRSFFYFLALGWAFKRMYCTASFIG